MKQAMHTQGKEARGVSCHTTATWGGAQTQGQLPEQLRTGRQPHTWQHRTHTHTHTRTHTHAHTSHTHTPHTHTHTTHTHTTHPTPHTAHQTLDITHHAMSHKHTHTHTHHTPHSTPHSTPPIHPIILIITNLILSAYHPRPWGEGTTKLECVVFSRFPKGLGPTLLWGTAKGKGGRKLSTTISGYF